MQKTESAQLCEIVHFVVKSEHILFLVLQEFAKYRQIPQLWCLGNLTMKSVDFVNKKRIY